MDSRQWPLAGCSVVRSCRRVRHGVTRTGGASGERGGLPVSCRAALLLLGFVLPVAAYPDSCFSELSTVPASDETLPSDGLLFLDWRNGVEPDEDFAWVVSGVAAGRGEL